MSLLNISPQSVSLDNYKYGFTKIQIKKEFRSSLEVAL